MLEPVVKPELERLLDSIHNRLCRIHSPHTQLVIMGDLNRFVVRLNRYRSFYDRLPIMLGVDCNGIRLTIWYTTSDIPHDVLLSNRLSILKVGVVNGEPRRHDSRDLEFLMQMLDRRPRAARRLIEHLQRLDDHLRQHEESGSDRRIQSDDLVR